MIERISLVPRINRKKLIYLLFVLIIVVSTNLLKNNETRSQPSLQTPTPLPTLTVEFVPPQKESLETSMVSSVVDGDTVTLASGKTLRYIGIDTPETKKPQTLVQCFGKEATAKNKELVDGKTVYLEKDVSETDRYGRLLRYVYIVQSEFSENLVMVNALLVQEGFAVAVTFPPDVKYQGVFSEHEKSAREKLLGLWSSCNLDTEGVQ